MHLAVVRGEAERYVTIVQRADGVQYQVGGIGRKFAIPHDFTHYIVEQTLGLTRGFWGTVASGGVFSTMQHVAGRHKPHAAEHSRAVLRSNLEWIKQSESIVGIFTVLFDGSDAPTARALLANHPIQQGDRSAPLSAAQIEEVMSALQNAHRRWVGFPVGGRIDLEWLHAD